MQRAWNGLNERAALQSQGLTPPRRGKKSKQSGNPEDKPSRPEIAKNYKTIAKFITTDLNITELIQRAFDENIKETSTTNFCLTGLHTCGNLAATCLQVFNAQPNCRILCNIGCCYHLLQEAYNGPEFFGNKAVFSDSLNTLAPGFPLSRFLNEKQLKLGRNARMLAAQSLERTINSKELPHISMYYRALLEVLLCQFDPTMKDTVQVGKIKKFNNFQEYLQICAKKLNMNEAICESENVKIVEQNYAVERLYLDLFYLLRMSFSPVLESLILLDRLLYLHENGHEQSYLLSVFDAVISPRHFGIVSVKR